MSGRKVIVLKIIVLFVIIFALARITALHSRRNPDAAHQQPFGRYTAQQMIDRATPIFRFLLPQQKDMLLSAEAYDRSDNGRDMRRYWNLDCTNKEGDVLARLVYDADTGDVRNVKRNGLMIDLPTAKVMRAHPAATQEITYRAQEWLRTLGYAENWRIDELTQHGSSARDIRLSAEKRTADLVIDAATGILLFAEIQPAP